MLFFGRFGEKRVSTGALGSNSARQARSQDFILRGSIFENYKIQTAECYNQAWA